MQIGSYGLVISAHLNVNNDSDRINGIKPKSRSLVCLSKIKEAIDLFLFSESRVGLGLISVFLFN